MEKYSGKSATRILKLNSPFVFALEEVHDKLGCMLDEQPVSEVPATFTMPLDETALDEKEIARVMDNVPEFEKQFEQFIDLSKLVFADIDGAETQVASISFDKTPEGLVVSINKVFRIHDEIEPMKVSLSSENLAAVKKFIETKMKER